MLNSHKKLSVGVLLGAMTLGISSIAHAESMYVGWYMAEKLEDCMTTCKTSDMHVVMSSTDHKNKPLSICATKGRLWLVGHNRWKENTCAAATVNGKVFHGKRYFCLCTTHGIQPLN